MKNLNVNINTTVTCKPNSEQHTNLRHILMIVLPFRTRISLIFETAIHLRPLPRPRLCEVSSREGLITIVPFSSSYESSGRFEKVRRGPQLTSWCSTELFEIERWCFMWAIKSSRSCRSKVIAWESLIDSKEFRCEETWSLDCIASFKVFVTLESS
jgi:hypothetical protein